MIDKKAQADVVQSITDHISDILEANGTSWMTFHLDKICLKMETITSEKNIKAILFSVRLMKIDQLKFDLMVKMQSLKRKIQHSILVVIVGLLWYRFGGKTMSYGNRVNARLCHGITICWRWGEPIQHSRSN